jgi:hypothetical protein
MAKLTKEQVLANAQELVTQIQAACAAIDTETDPSMLLNHMGFIRDRGRTEALRRVVQDRALELFKAQRESK